MSFRYMVEVPKASAKRLENDRRLVVVWHHGFGTCETAHPIPPGEEVFEFTMDREREHREPRILDGDWSHQFYVEFRNSTGSRIERVEVDPLDIT